MLKISDISEGLTDIIKKEMNVDETKAEQIEYGIYMFISETVKIAVVLIIAAILNIFKYTVIAIIIFGIHRGFIGGVHAKTHWGCFLSYNAIIFGTLFLSFNLNINKIVLALVLYPICMLIAYLYAPADILNKPVISKRQRRYLRTGGFIFLTIVFALAIFVPQPYSNILMIITIIECITMLPIIYKITGNEYGRKEVV
ncbi:MAG TPA: accessory regulator AgrB [Clostridiaceae bacterium]|nr:accessory regulator AgrB [Clostridiaceae bacterium]